LSESEKEWLIFQQTLNNLNGGFKNQYLGIELKNPVILGASNLVTHRDMLKRAEDAGVAAIVYKSLFEEQIQLNPLSLMMSWKNIMTEC